MALKQSFRRRKTLSGGDPCASLDEHTALTRSTEHMIPSTSIPPFVIRATAIASLGGILFGYDMGVISGALPQLTPAFHLTQNQQQLVVGILYLGGGLGAAVGGTLCDALGRKSAILLTDVVFGIGAAILCWANSLAQLVVGRIVMGFAIAVSGIADVAYLNEMAPKEWRGAIVSVNEACISLGFLLAYVAGYTFRGDSGWRYMFGLSGLVALGQFVGMCGMPESPLWLKEKGRLEESHSALRIIYGAAEGSIPPDAEDVSAATNVAPHVTDASGHQGAADKNADRILLPMLRRYHKQAWIALFLSVAQQMSGQTNVLNYAPLIFSPFAEGDDASMSSTLWIGLVKFVVTGLVIWRIEYMGRRLLLLGGMSVICVGLLLLTLAFSLGAPVENENGELVPPRGGMFLALPGVLLVVTGYSASFGPLTWLLTAELFPTDIRGRALGVSTIVTYLCAFLATSTFLTAQAWFGGYVFLCYAAFTFMGILFAYFAIPDTGDKTVSEIEDELLCMWWWKRENYSVVESAHLYPDRAILETELT
jgi:sugar porter (SP) family MFS transporter